MAVGVPNARAMAVGLPRRQSACRTPARWQSACRDGSRRAAFQSDGRRDGASFMAASRSAGRDEAEIRGHRQSRHGPAGTSVDGRLYVSTRVCAILLERRETLIRQRKYGGGRFPARRSQWGASERVSRSARGERARKQSKYTYFVVEREGDRVVRRQRSAGHGCSLEGKFDCSCFGAAALVRSWRTVLFCAAPLLAVPAASRPRTAAPHDSPPHGRAARLTIARPRRTTHHRTTHHRTTHTARSPRFAHLGPTLAHPSCREAPPSVKPRE
jgi:hypothetical protein